ncbi:MAG TPA: hypothetical protein EYH22_03415 [Candidatus Nanopusillus sp.]|nr:hypothetical protein [Candidatus Nanopusillus sp.]
MLEFALILLAGTFSFYFKKYVEEDIRLFEVYLKFVILVLSALLLIFTKILGVLLLPLILFYLYNRKSNFLLAILLLYLAALSTLCVHCYLLALAITILLVWLY